MDNFGPMRQSPEPSPPSGGGQAASGGVFFTFAELYASVQRELAELRSLVLDRQKGLEERVRVLEDQATARSGVSTWWKGAMVALGVVLALGQLVVAALLLTH